MDLNDRRVNRIDILYGLGLFLLTVLSRIPFRSQILYHWDAVNFAFAMQRFDVVTEQPQPPGYIAYVWLCQLVDALFHDPQTTMVWIAIVGSGLAVVAMCLLGQAMFGRRTGLVAALFLASSPLFWFYGEIALPHAVDAFLVILSAWLLYEVLLGRAWALVPVAVSLAVAGGVRQQTPVFLALLALFAGVRFLQRVGWGRGWRWVALAVAIFGLLCAGWFLPLIASTGGLDRYLQVVSNYSARFTATTSLFMGAGSFGLTRNLRKLAMYTLYGWGVAPLPVAVSGLMLLRRRQLAVQWERALFLLTWVFPSLFFYVLIHMGQQGLVFVFLPILLLVSARALVRLAENRKYTVLLAGVSLLLVMVNAALFIALPEYPLGRERFKVLSWDTLRRNDAYYQERFDGIRERFSPESTAIIASRWRHVQWYLPEYSLLRFEIPDKQEAETGSAANVGPETRLVSPADLGLQPDPAREAVMVIFDPELRAFNRSEARTTRLALGGGGALDILTLSAREQLFYGPGGFGVRGD